MDNRSPEDGRRGFLRAAPRRCRLAATAGAVALAAISLPASAGASGSAKAADLDQVVVSVWAHAHVAAPVWHGPSRSSRSVGRLHVDTEDGLAEVYPVIGSYVDALGRNWRQVRLPGRPAGRTGWVLRSQLEREHVVRSVLLIDRRRTIAKLYRGRSLVWRARVGVGAEATPTPAGDFWIRERFGTRRPGGMYGPYVFGTSAYSSLSDWPGGGVVGIHGTNQPRLVPGRPSHGCIRLRNADVRRLWRLMRVGTIVRIV